MTNEPCTLEDLEATVRTTAACYVNDNGQAVEFIDLPRAGDIDMDNIEHYYCSGCETYFGVKIPSDPIATATAWQEALGHLPTNPNPEP
jgi:hypothetical protein